MQGAPDASTGKKELKSLVGVIHEVSRIHLLRKSGRGGHLKLMHETLEV